MRSVTTLLPSGANKRPPRERRLPKAAPEYPPGYFAEPTLTFPPGFVSRLTARGDPLCILPSAQMLAWRRNQEAAAEATKVSPGGFGTMEHLNVPSYIKLKPMPVR